MASTTTLRARLAPQTLILTATMTLFVFYYLGRVDVIATLSPTRGVHAVTGPALHPSWHFLTSALLLAVVPTLAARFGVGRRVRELGLGLGRWRLGVVLLGVGIPLAIIAGAIGAGSPAMRFVYPLNPAIRAAPSSFAPYAALQFLYFGAWEILFRGVLLFGLKDRLGAGPANALQTALSVIAHFGRPLTETLAALPAGLVFGALTLRTRSIWYIAVIHWSVGVSMDWFILRS